jgi:primosomal replication protein N
VNKLVLSGVVVALDQVRYTPAGLPLLSFVISHVSEVVEAGMKRKVECEVNAIAIGDLAKSNFQIGANINVAGFVAKRSAKSSQLVLHLLKIEVLEN